MGEFNSLKSWKCQELGCSLQEGPGMPDEKYMIKPQAHRQASQVCMHKHIPWKLLPDTKKRWLYPFSGKENLSQEDISGDNGISY